ncbi:hypothetical protein SAMCFNEI73_Ch2083 [Sinorhizobium americanum]|uniref:Uncharacterized protein n=1 Tax=Sinorhizobium americanum TaxID=194963 RepID=A0A1L3LMP1_9HYPH|nr:hypothetical protein SAMCFNEI73_Ch2083 [Sinorhizobium americanum]
MSSPEPGISLPRRCRLVKGPPGPAASYNRLKIVAMRSFSQARGRRCTTRARRLHSLWPFRHRGASSF